MSRSYEKDTIKPLKSFWRYLLDIWLSFFRVVLDPHVLIMFLITLFFIHLSRGRELEESKYIQPILTLIISIFSGITGAFIANKYKEIYERSMLITRGNSAIRGLMLLVRNVSYLKNRVSFYIIDLKKLEENPTIKICYEEIVEKCNSLRDEALNAIEEWKDIIPEADIKNRMDEIETLREEKNLLVLEMKKIGEELRKEKNKSEYEIEYLKRELKRKENELYETNNRFAEKVTEFNKPFLSGFEPKISIDGIELGMQEIKCDLCKKTFLRDIGIISLRNICDECSASKK